MRISAWIFATSSSFFRSSRTFSMRSVRGRVSRTACSSCLLAVVRLAAKSANGDGSLGPKRDRKMFSSSLYSGLSGMSSLKVLMIAIPYALTRASSSGGISG